MPGKNASSLILSQPRKSSGWSRNDGVTPPRRHIASDVEKCSDAASDEKRDRYSRYDMWKGTRTMGIVVTGSSTMRRPSTFQA